MHKNINLFHDTTYIKYIKVVKVKFNLPLDKVQKIKDFHFDINIAQSVKPITDIQDQFYILKSIDIKIIGKLGENESEHELAEFGMEYAFTYNNVNNFISFSGGSIIVDEELTEWLDNIVLSTTRGTMYSELRGSYIDDIYFPLIKPADLKLHRPVKLSHV